MAQPGRQLINGNKRANGTVFAWSGRFGWIDPPQAIPHPDASKNNGRIYVGLNDVTLSNGELKKGDKVSFVIYRDNKGLGAQDCQVRSGGQQQANDKGNAKAGVLKTISKEKWKGQASNTPPPKAGVAPGKGGSKGGVPTKTGSSTAGWIPSKVLEKDRPANYQSSAKGAGKGSSSNAASSSWKPPAAKPAGVAGTLPAGFQSKPKMLQMNAKAAPGASSSKGVGKGAPPKAGAPAAKAGVQQHHLKQNNNQQQQQKPQAAGTSGPSAGSGPSKAKRLRVLSGKRVKGTVAKWGGPPSGPFGFIKPHEKIHHAEAHKREGMLYLHSTDCAPGVKVHMGAQVEFFVYADPNGLGAEDVRKIGSAPATPAKPATTNNQLAGKSNTSPAKAGTPNNQWGGKGQSPAKAATPSNEAKGKGKGGTPQSNATSSQNNQNQYQTKAQWGWNQGSTSKTWNQGSTSKTPQQQQQQNKSVQQTQWQKKPVGAQQQAQKKWEPKGKPPQPTGKPPLPKNWEEHWSDEHGVPYYWNSVTKKSVWVQPTS